MTIEISEICVNLGCIFIIAGAFVIIVRWLIKNVEVT